MAFYKLETTHNVIPLSGKSGRVKRTYKWFCNSWESMILRLESEIIMAESVKVKEISESEYIRGTR